MKDGGAAVLCPAHSDTAGATGSSSVLDCSCVDGYMRDDTSGFLGCVQCPPDTYCAAGVATPCPCGKTAPVGSDRVEDCISIAPGVFGPTEVLTVEGWSATSARAECSDPSGWGIGPENATQGASWCANTDDGSDDYVQVRGPSLSCKIVLMQASIGTDASAPIC